MSLVTDLCQGVADHLNGTLFTTAFNAGFAYMPDYSEEQLETLRVSVVPGSVAPVRATRSLLVYEVSVGILIQQRILQEEEDGDEEDQIEGLLTLAEEIGEYIVWNPIEGVQFVRIENDPMIEREHLLSKRIFSSVITATYQVSRAKE